jgi:hypothetical protein
VVGGGGCAEIAALIQWPSTGATALDAMSPAADVVFKSSRAARNRFACRTTMRSDTMNAKTRKPYRIVEAGWQSTKLRLVALPLMGGGIVGLYYSPWLLTSLPDVDGQLEPFGARIGLAALVAFVSLLCTVGLWCYQSIYVARLVRDGDLVIVHTQGLLQLNEKHLPIKAFHSSKAYSGRMLLPGKPFVNAPFQTMTVEGWWLPLLVDEQSEYLDGIALTQILRDSEVARRKQVIAAA